MMKICLQGNLPMGKPKTRVEIREARRSGAASAVRRLPGLSRVDHWQIWRLVCQIQELEVEDIPVMMRGVGALDLADFRL